MPFTVYKDRDRDTTGVCLSDTLKRGVEDEKGMGHERLDCKRSVETGI